MRKQRRTPLCNPGSGPLQSLRCSVIGGKLHALKSKALAASGFRSGALAKLAAATTLKADYDDYFGYSTSILGDTVLDFEMTKKHINILAIGASYTGDPRMHEAIAEGFGGSANFLVLSGTLSGRVLNHFEGDSINLERDRSQYVRLSDVLHTRNMDDYQSRAENRAVADMIEKVTEAAGTGGWDVVTVTPHSRWGNRPNVWQYFLLISLFYSVDVDASRKDLRH